MSPRTGLILRLLGPAIQLGCLVLLFRPGVAGSRLLGVPVEYALYAGLALGLSMVAAGLILVRPQARGPRNPR
jgi:hypothetical protein